MSHLEENRKLEKGIEAIEQGDFQGAFVILSKLASEGNQIAQINVATLYQSGNGVEADGKSAIYWFSKAAEQVDKDKKLAGLAHHNLHVLYLCGAKGVESNRELANSHLQKAIELGVDF